MDKLKDMTGVSGSGRTMKYPYTFTSQLRQFPYRYYWNNVWLFRYWIYACGVCLPLFHWIKIKSYSPENVAKWKEIRRKEKEEHHH